MNRARTTPAEFPLRWPLAGVPRRGCTAIALAAGLCVSLAEAQPVDDAPSAFSGADFGGLRLVMPAQRGGIVAAGQRAWSWAVEPALANPAGQTVGGTVQRLLIEGDVEINLGGRKLAAARAALWIEALEPSVRFPGQSIYQVAVYLDRAGDPTASVGSSVAGDRVLVTAVVDGPAQFSFDNLVPGRPAPTILGGASVSSTGAAAAFLAEAEARFARAQANLARPQGAAPIDQTVTPSPLTGQRLDDTPFAPGMSGPFEPFSALTNPRDLGRLVRRARRDDPDAMATLSGDDASRRRVSTGALFASRGLLTFSAGNAELIGGGAADAENTLVLTGGAVVIYSDQSRDRTLQLTAEHAVVFLAPGAITDLARADASTVRGVYLGGDVQATDGSYSIRAPEAFYDVRANQAVLLDAVFWTYDQAAGLPLYVRAAAIRQTAENQFDARDVKLSASSFFEPQFSIGAREITVTRTPGTGAAPDQTKILAKGVTGRAEGLPFFYLPSYTGDLERFPLKGLSFEGASNSGAGVRTRWDVLGLAGVEAPRGTQADLLLDAYLRRGFGIGGDAAWGSFTDDAIGSFYGYLVPDDRGRDVTPSGREIDRKGEVRGVVLVDHTMTFDDFWSLRVEAAHSSDANFLNSYDRQLAETRREFASLAYLRGAGERQYFDLLIKGSTNNFLANQYLLQSQGYAVNRFPEARFFRINDDFFAATTPGLITWTQSYSLSNLSLQFSKASAQKLGFDTPFLSLDALGVQPGQSPADVLRQQGYVDSSVLRADTRQEFNSQLNLGPVKINPFLIGRATAYDNGFERYQAPGAPPPGPGSNGTGDRLRLWYGGGVRASTEFQRTYDSAESALLDIHRLRHVVEPSVTLFSAGTNVPRSLLPVYDQDVESISEGSSVRAGVNQVFQTYRGGPGRDRTVDFLKINTDIVLSTSDTDKQSPLGRFFDFAPERSQLGNYQLTEAIWQVTDAAALTFSNTYDIDRHINQRTTAGVQLQHSPDLSSYFELRFLKPRSVTYVTTGTNLRLSATYSLGTFLTIDTDEGKVQLVGVQVRREFPMVMAVVSMGYNEITNQFSIGLTLRPPSADRRLQLLQRINPTQLDALGGGIGGPNYDPAARGGELPGGL